MSKDKKKKTYSGKINITVSPSCEKKLRMAALQNDENFFYYVSELLEKLVNTKKFNNNEEIIEIKE